MRDNPISDSSETAELRHRLANLFQLLSTAARMRGQRAQDPETRRQLGWMVDAIGAVSVLQQRLLNPDGEDFALYLEEMLDLWRRRCGARPIIVDLQAESVRVREQSLSALALIAHELVSNALTHAFVDGRSGNIRLELSRIDAARAVFSITDDGCGYAPDGVGDKTLGLWLIKGLAGQIRGDLTTSATTEGVRVQLEFPTSADG